MLQPPRWFVNALAFAPEHRTIDVAGTAVHYLSWGEKTKPGLVLVHGGAAHAEWWSFIAPLLARHHRVVAPDLSGHGESGWRERYPRPIFADDVMAVIEDAAFVGPPVLVGHSMGGLVSIVAGSLYGDRLAGAVIVDAPVRKPDPESQERATHGAVSQRRVYADLETAIARFRLVPAQPCENDFIVDH